jgi:hypothetical protein
MSETMINSGEVVEIEEIFQNVKEKKTKPPVLSAKFMRYKVFSYWLVNQLKEKDLVNAEAINEVYNTIEFYSPIESQTELYTQFEKEFFKESKKAMTKEITAHNKPAKKRTPKKTGNTDEAKPKNQRKKKTQEVAVIAPSSDQDDLYNQLILPPMPPSEPTPSIVEQPPSNELIEPTKVTKPKAKKPKSEESEESNEAENPPKEKKTKAKKSKSEEATEEAIPKETENPPKEKKTKAKKSKSEESTEVKAKESPKEKNPKSKKSKKSEESPEKPDLIELSTSSVINQLPSQKDQILEEETFEEDEEETIEAKTAIVNGKEIYYDSDGIAYDIESNIIGKYNPITNIFTEEIDEE